MVIILTEFLNSEQTVHLTGLLFSVENVIFAVTDRKFLIRMHRALVRHHCVRAVHRLCCHSVLSVNGILFRRLVALDCSTSINALRDARNDEHVVLIVCPVT